MKKSLIFIGAVLLLVAVLFLVWGMVEVAQAKKGTWGIWYFYLIHGVVGLAAFVCFFAGAEKKAPEAKAVEEGGVEK